MNISPSSEIGLKLVEAVVSDDTSKHSSNIYVPSTDKVFSITPFVPLKFWNYFSNSLIERPLV